MRKLLLFALLLLVPALLAPAIHAQCAGGGTCNLTSPSAATLQTALNTINTDGTAVNITGNVSWTGAVTYTQTNSFVLQGQTTVTGACTSVATCVVADHTTITIPSTSGSGYLNISTIAGKTFRMTGLSFNILSGVAAFGTINIGGNSTSVRVDHNHFVSANAGEHTIHPGGPYGVYDHNFFDATPDVNLFFFQFTNPGASLYGNESWTQPENFGTSQFIFAENNVFQNATFAFDCFTGGRFVFRHNTMGIYDRGQYHGLTPAFQRGCRAYEVYDNTAQYVPSPSDQSTCGPGGTSLCYFSFWLDLEGGAGMIWGNTVGGYGSIVQGDTARSNSSTYHETAVPNGWGYCSTSPLLGVPGPSPWDGPSAYPCMDGIGRGAGQLVTGNGSPFSNIINSVSGTQSWTNQAQVPIYVWSNTLAPIANTALVYWGNFDPPSASARDRDYYLQLPNVNQGSTFNGGAGIGSGTLVPTNASAYTNAPNCTPAVGYWDTTNQTLYKCISTNTWTAFYTPYTYPHPLVTGGSGPVTLSPTSENFGVVNLGFSSSPVTFTLTNGSSVTATSISPSVTGGNSGDFTITNSGAGSCAAASGSIAAAASCTFTVTFTPSATGIRSTTLSVSYGGGDGASPQTAALSGNPSAGTPTFSPVAGTYVGGQTVTISSSATTVVCYNTTGLPATNGSTGCATGSTLYTVPVNVPVSETLYAAAGGTGYVDATSSAVYNITTGPTFVQACNAGTTGTTSSTTISCTFPANVGAHHFLGLGFYWGDAVTKISSVNSNLGLTYTVLTNGYGNSSAISTGFVYVCDSGAGGAETVTVNLSASIGYHYWAGVEAGNIALSTCVDGTANLAQSTVGTVTPTSASYSTTNAKDMLLGFFGSQGGCSPWTAGTDGQANNFTIPANGSNAGVALEYIDENAIATYSASSGCSGSSGWNASMIALKQASGSVTISPSSQNFGSFNVGSPSSAVTFTVTNNSNSTATGVSPITTGGNNTDFVISNNTCGSLATNGGACTFEVTFTPSAPGSRNTTLSVSYSGGDGASPKTGSLSGTGITPPPTVGTTLSGGASFGGGVKVQ